MKLIYCRKCQDLVKLQKINRFCWCNKSWGHYVDNINVVIGGAAIAVGMNNNDFQNGLWFHLDGSLPHPITTFFISDLARTVEREEEK